MNEQQVQELADHLINDEVVIMPSDTIYGFACDAFNEALVNRVFEIKKRDQNKRFIVLISDPQQLSEFGVSKENIQTATRVWDEVDNTLN